MWLMAGASRPYPANSTWSRVNIRFPPEYFGNVRPSPSLNVRDSRPTRTVTVERLVALTPRTLTS